MELSSEIKRNATRYLLGEATDEEQIELEVKYFSDQGFFEQVVAVEKELLDDYARDRLSARERKLFERHYLAHPRRRVRASTASALAAKLDQSKPLKVETTESSWWRDLFTGFRAQSLAFGMAAAALLLALGGILLLLETRRLHSELAQSRIAQATTEQREREFQELLREQQGRNKQLSAELERLQAGQQTSTSPSAPSFVSLLLTAGLARDGNQGESPRLVIPSGIEKLRLQLKIKEDKYPRYRLSVETPDGRTIRTIQNLKPNLSKIFTITLSSRLFPDGEYVLALSGINDNGETDNLSKSIFRVESKMRGTRK